MEVPPAPVYEIEVPPPPPEKRVWGGWATAGLGAVTLFVFFTVMVLVMAIMAVALAVTQFEPVMDPGDLTDLIFDYLGLMVGVAGIVSSSVGFGFILVIIKAKRHGKGIAEYLGLRRVGWRTLLLAVVVTGIYWVLVSVVGVFFGIEGDGDIMVDIYATSVWPPILWIYFIMFAPLFEEPFARGFLFEGFRRSRIGLIGAVLLTSLVWTALHVGYSFFSLGAIFVFGIILGYARYRTDSLWPPLLMHAVFNGISTTLLALSSV